MGAIPKRNDLVSRIERLERLVRDLSSPNVTQPVPPPLAPEESPSEQAALYVKNGEVVTETEFQS
jgi:hypothetical protein